MAKSKETYSQFSARMAGVRNPAKAIHRDHAEFIHAFRSGKLLRVKFWHKRDGYVDERLVGPQDYGPNARAKSRSKVYWFTDMIPKDPLHPHPFPKHASDIIYMKSVNKPYNREFFARYQEDHMNPNQKTYFGFVREALSAQDFISGGKADRMTAQSIADKHGVSKSKILGQIAKGIVVELEHTDDHKKAKEIALDHLAEFPDYYDRLGRMEDAAKTEWGE